VVRLALGTLVVLVLRDLSNAYGFLWVAGILAALLLVTHRVWWDILRAPARAAERRKALLMGRMPCGPAPTSPTVPTGIAVEWGYPGLVVTLAAFDDGFSQVMFSPRASIIGPTNYPALQNELAILRQDVGRLAGGMTPLTTLAFPKSHQVAVHVISAAGTVTSGPLDVHSASAPDQPLSAPYRRAREVLGMIIGTVPSVAPPAVIADLAGQ
jgi:hypothetical protein